MCGTKLGLATAYHQQTDGQSERQVRTLEESLRCFVNASGNDWDDRLQPWTELNVANIFGSQPSGEL